MSALEKKIELQVKLKQYRDEVDKLLAELGYTPDDNINVKLLNLQHEMRQISKTYEDLEREIQKELTEFESKLPATIR